MTFKLMAIEIPTGAGMVNKVARAGTVNKITATESRRSSFHARNFDTQSLARSITVGLASKQRGKTALSVQK
jgi:hypothetical protein